MSPDLRDNGTALLPDVTPCSLPLPSGFFLPPLNQNQLLNNQILILIFWQAYCLYH